MKTACAFAVAMCCLFAAKPAHAALSFISDCESATTGCTPATRAVGDLIVTCAYKASITAPSAPTGYTAIAGTSATGSSSSQNCACRIATNNASDAATWTSTAGAGVAVYRGEFDTGTCTNNFGAATPGTAASTTLTYSAITPTGTKGYSWILGFAGQTSATTLSSNGTPAGVTQRVTTGAIATAVLWDTNGAEPQTGASKTATITSANQWRSIQLEIFGAKTCVGALCVVQHAVATSVVSAVTVAATLTTTTANNALIACTGNNGTRTVTQIVDNASGVNFFQQVASANAVATALETDCWYVPKITNGTATTVTVTFSGAAGTFGKWVEVWEVSGFVAAAFDVKGIVNAGAQAAGVATGSSVTPTTATNAVFGVDMSNGTITAATVFTSGSDILTAFSGSSLLQSSASAAQPTWTDGGSSFASSSVAFKELGAPSGSGTPTLVQEVHSSSNVNGGGIDGNTFVFALPNAVLAGNALVLKVAWNPNPSTHQPLASGPITDNNSNVWPTNPVCHAVDVNTNEDMALWVLPSANAGLTTITINFALALHQVQYDVSEWQNIDANSPANGCSTNGGNQNAPSLTTGSFTPTVNNDSHGGNLILNFCWDDSNAGSGNAVTTFTAGTSFTLLDADITWSTDANGHNAGEYFVQSTSAAINPALSAPMTPLNDQFNCMAAALKAASHGTAPAAGIRIVKVHHFTTTLAASTTIPVQFPTTGSNLIDVTTQSSPGQSSTTFSAVNDNNGNSYVNYTLVNDQPYQFVTQGATTDSNLKITITKNTGTPVLSLRLYEITGAATVGAVDTQAGLSTTACTTTQAHAPDITPASSNGLTIAVLYLGQGPGLAITSPTGNIWDLVTYAGETDLDLMENADGTGHFYNSSTAAENWTWSVTNATSCSASAVHIAQAVAVTSALQRLLMGVGQ